jgi:hypothetical protein
MQLNMISKPKHLSRDDRGGGVTARAADEEDEGEVEAAETGSRRVYRGPVLSHRMSGRPIAKSFIE